MHRRFITHSIVLLFALVFSLDAFAMPKSTATAGGKAVTGTVIETMNSAGYTYMLVAVGTVQNWVAIPEAPVKTGSQVSYFEGLAMPSFTSKTLNRTFENIVFSAGLAAGADSALDTQAAKATPAKDAFSAALQAEQMGVDAAVPTGQVTGGSAVAIAPMQEISIPKAVGANGYTVEEVFSKAPSLAGKKIRIQGKVVKFSAGIMGKNWVHLQDGTGNPLQNFHDLVCTTDATPAVDSIVTMEGILAVDKDFGAGYKYTAIVEQASLIK